MQYLDWIRLIAVVGALVTMGISVRGVFERMKAKEQGFGPNSLKALGMALFIPTLIIVGAAMPNFQTETLAALLGTVAGYVLSQSREEK